MIPLAKCDHAGEGPNHGTCAACTILGRHSRRSGGCTCDLCRLVVRANDESEDTERRYWLLAGCDLVFEELLWIWRSAGLDETAVLVLLREWEFAPNGAIDPRDWEARAEALHTMPYADYLRTPEWAEQRRRARLRAGDRCQTCDSPDNLDVHHRTYDRRGYEEPGDLIVLCSACHTAVHLVADARRGTIRKTSKRARV